MPDLRRKPRLRFSDQLAEALNSLVERPGRTVSNGLGIALGIATAVAVFTIADTASHEISTTFDALGATQVIVKLSPDAMNRAVVTGESPFPVDSEQRMDTLAGADGSGISTVRRTRIEIRSNDVIDPSSRSSIKTPLVSATPGALDAAEIVVAGRALEPWHEAQQTKVALVGRTVADSLRIQGTDATQAILIEGIPFTITGVIKESGRNPSLLQAVVIPESTGATLWPIPDEPPQLLIRTAPGAAQGVTRAAPLVLRPESPQSFSVSEPPDPKAFRQSIETDVAGLYLALSVISLALGAVGIANTTLLMVMERSKEFGLRRAVGARPSHIVRHVLTDTALLGFVSGAIGVVSGISVALVVASQRGWRPVMDPRLVILGPLAGMVVGVLAGLVPALRAKRIEPSDALLG